MRIQVILPTVRGIDWLGMTISSLLMQSKVEWISKICIVNDNGNLCDKYCLLDELIEMGKYLGVEIKVCKGRGGDFYEYKPNYIRFVDRVVNDYILILDDDLVLDKYFLEELVKHGEDKDIISGFMKIASGYHENLTDEVLEFEQGKDWLLVGMSLFREEVLREGFKYNYLDKWDKGQPTRNKDKYWLDHLQAKGYQFKIVKSAVAWHLGNDSHFDDLETDLAQYRKEKGI